MTTVTVHQAKTHLSRLIDRVLGGDEVVVTRRHEPVVALKPISLPKNRRRLGGLRGIVTAMADDFDAPLADFKEYSS
jgi:prevent-host-death family protein